MQKIYKRRGSSGRMTGLKLLPLLKKQRRAMARILDRGYRKGKHIRNLRRVYCLNHRLQIRPEAMYLVNLAMLLEAQALQEREILLFDNIINEQMLQSWNPIFQEEGE